MANISIDTVRARRSASVWTRIHPIFALGQLGAFVVSVGFLGAYFAGWVNFAAVHESVLIKIALMIGAIVSGALWEHDVFGPYWFAPEFFFEDAMTVNVFLLHIGYLVIVYTEPGNLDKAILMLGLAYLVYLANVVQYIWRTHKMGVDTGAAAAVRVKS
jgi:3-vinyl bacteriochlorophyllide hydratase